jgi:uncharacterized damage-inducible protein DinB
MLSVNNYTQKYIDECRSRVAEHLSAYQALVAAARNQAGIDEPLLSAAIEAFEPHFFNNTVLALNSYFVHNRSALGEEHQMTVKDLEDLYDYGYWANRKLFHVISQLTPGEFTRPVGGSYGSVRNTMVHALSAEWGWLDRCGGRERGPRLNPDDFPTVESLLAAWNKVEGYVREFLSKLKDEDLARNIEYSIGRSEGRSMPLGELMHHAAIHGVHHRGQLALLLRMLGYAPGNFDLLFYNADKGGVPAW